MSARALIGLLMVVFFYPVQVNAASIDVEVRNRYRAFDYLTPTPQQSAALFERYAPTSSDANTLAWMQRLMTPHVGSPYSQSKTGPWDENADKDHLPYQADFLEPPKTLAIRAALTEDAGDVNKTCNWSAGHAAATQKCSLPFEPQDAIAIGTRIAVAVEGQEVASSVLNPKVRVILGLGDSYSAGEGSPDVPVIWKENISAEFWPTKGSAPTKDAVMKPTEWLSNRCNRSFYSYQNMVALRLASEDKHSIVSFVHLACAGAEILDGVLAPQRVAPGAPESCKPPAKGPDSKDQVDPSCDVPSSQLRAAAMVLCPDHATLPASQAEKSAVARYFASLKHGREDQGGADQSRWINDLLACKHGSTHPVELTLISIGGNDIGFGGLIAWGLLPRKSIIPGLMSIVRKEGGAVCPVHGGEDGEGACKELSARERLEELPTRYEALNKALADILGINGKTIVATQYPDPLFDADGKLCSNEANKVANNQWTVLRMEVGGVWSQYWQINLTEWEAGEVEQFVISPLNEAIKTAADKHGWRLSQAASAFKGHGWCVGEDLALLDSGQAHAWMPYRPWGRYVRTANDSFLTQWPGRRKETPQRDDGLNGTVHPNALGYAAMADSTLASIRE